MTTSLPPNIERAFVSRSFTKSLPFRGTFAKFLTFEEIVECINGRLIPELNAFIKSTGDVILTEPDCFNFTYEKMGFAPVDFMFQLEHFLFMQPYRFDEDLKGKLGKPPFEDLIPIIEAEFLSKLPLLVVGYHTKGAVTTHAFFAGILMAMKRMKPDIKKRFSTRQFKRLFTVYAMEDGHFTGMYHDTMEEVEPYIKHSLFSCVDELNCFDCYNIKSNIKTVDTRILSQEELASISTFKLSHFFTYVVKPLK